jgi:hypothetical protein
MVALARRLTYRSKNMNDLPARSPFTAPAANAALAAVALTSVSAVVEFRLIQKFTNHRPLGAATLAVLVVFTFFALFAVTSRLRVNATVARAALGLAAVLLVAMLFVAG